MPAPFYNAINGTTSGTPGTGAFTPNAASTGFRAWSLVPTGWIGLVRYEDGSYWELTFSYWNGTTLSRASTQMFDSSTGTFDSITSAATAAMIVDASEVMSHLGGPAWRTWNPLPNSTISIQGIAAPTETGTAAAVTVATTNYLTEQIRRQSTSATTANAQAGWSETVAFALSSTTAGHGGWEFVVRFGASQLPTGPRLFVGMTGTTFVASTSEPGSLTAHLAVFGKDSTDTNIQLIVNSNASTGTKTDTGIALTANGWYEAAIWTEPGATKIFALLIRLDTGAIWYGTTTTDVPGNGAIMFPQVLGGLNATNTGTAIIMHVGIGCCRTGT